MAGGAVNRLPVETLRLSIGPWHQHPAIAGAEGGRSCIFERGASMRADWGILRRAMGIMFWSGLAVGLYGLFEPTWPASDPATATSQDQSTVPSDASDSSGKGPEGGGSVRHPVRRACAEDVKKLCLGVKAGEGRILQCLKGHTQELSQTCSDMLQQGGKRRH